MDEFLRSLLLHLYTFLVHTRHLSNLGIGLNKSF